MKTNTLIIRTPEGIAFAQLLAGPVTRCLAFAIDVVVIVAAINLVTLVLALAGAIAPRFVSALLILTFFVLSLAYWMVFEWYLRGQTIGKRMLRLRVVDAEGMRLQFSQVVIRNIVRLVDMLPGAYLIGGLCCLLSRRAQRLGDLAANTVVVRIPKIVEPDLDQIVGGKFNSLRSYPHLEARLRQSVSPTEARIGWQAIRRRELLDPEARVALFRGIAAHYREKVPFPPEATDGITDEQYVRNVLDAVFRPRGGAVRPPAEGATSTIHESIPEPRR